MSASSPTMAPGDRDMHTRGLDDRGVGVAEHQTQLVVSIPRPTG